MRRFLDDRETTEDEMAISATNSYIQIEGPIDDDISLFMYMVQKSENSFFVVTCWDDAFDFLLQGVDQDDLETIEETWPLFAQLLVNGFKDRYRDCAVIQLEDPDDGDKKWFVASVVGNLKMDSVEEVLGERTMKTVHKVLEKTAELASELQTNEPSVWKRVGKAAAGLAVGVLLGALGIPPSES